MSGSILKVCILNLGAVCIGWKRLQSHSADSSPHRHRITVSPKLMCKQNMTQGNRFDMQCIP